MANLVFFISITKNSGVKTGYSVQAVFQIKLHSKDEALLWSLAASLGIGKVTCRKDVVRYELTSVKELLVIINHFDKFPLITQKRADYILFKQVINFSQRTSYN